MQHASPPDAASEPVVRRIPIEDYALLGNCHSAALVSRDGSVDWLCFPRFDSAACCAALLGDDDNGFWSLAPTDAEARFTRRYRDGTMVLETTVETASGSALVVEVLTMDGDVPHLLRVVRGVRGSVDFRMQIKLRFDYGSLVPWVTRTEDGDLRLIAGAEMCFLRTPAELVGEGLSTVSEFTVRPGDAVPFDLAWVPSYDPVPPAVDVEALIESTSATWSEWAAEFDGTGWRYADAIKRSLVTLKAMIHYPTGGIVAAPTTSLPERIGGNRNWDYRYTWIRDATLTLSAMTHAGYRHEASAWRDWLLRAIAGAPEQMQILYGVAGDRRIPELELSWLAGYEDSKPVRLGNAASTQVQLDVYGDIMSALHMARLSGIGVADDGWAIQKALLAHLDGIWRDPDQGIWEIRGPARQFVHSKLMCWLAYEHSIRSAERFDLDGPIDAYRATRDEIRAQIVAEGFDAERNTFVQSYGAKALDASLLYLGMTGFLEADDPRLAGTVAAIEASLLRDGFVMRYDPKVASDGVEDGQEGVFLACSFWLADNYRILGREADARRLFERCRAICNDVGLLSEEYDPRAKRMLGNFPQAFSHLALVNSALDLGKNLRDDVPAPE